jgi:YD repeat-containing protein
MITKSTQSPLTITKYVFDANGNPTYIGEAPRGTSTSSVAWKITKYVWDANDLPQTKTTAFDSWDNYLTATYA